eukprot:gnl/Trimastix_PCT/2610.p1 GENE.gnl/Trimastix_PCT/2610~~gnl/Trimastix_PCT/2610.p1  ORF type:complete len:415 (+),score=76.34 gnl/Trimastix_PCT/2610:29-1246(+)
MSKLWFLLFALCVAGIKLPEPICNIVDYGAVGDEKTMNTKAIQKAIDTCRSKHEGRVTVLVPEGIYLTGSIVLYSDMTLLLQDCVIKGSTNPKDYPIVGPIPSYSPSRTRMSLIYGENLTNLRIQGNGVIDGQGPYFWRKHRGSPEVMQFRNLRKGSFTGFQMKDSPGWTFRLIYSTDIVIDGLTINAPEDSPCTDAIDIDSTSNVLIQNCLISTGDDVVAIKSGRNAPGRLVNIPSENITVQDCTFSHSHGIAIGSEMSGSVRNVHVRRCRYTNAQRGIRVKTDWGRGGVVENVLFEDIEIDAVGTVIEVDMAYNHAPHTNRTEDIPHFRNIWFRNIRGEANLRAGYFYCLKEAPCEVFLENVDIKAILGWDCEHAKGTATNVHPHLRCLDPMPPPPPPHPTLA